MFRGFRVFGRDTQMKGIRSQICKSIHVYIYIYVERGERERELIGFL